MEEYTKLNLQQLSIYELRSIARNTGVKSPTTKRHNELIESILKIQNGEEQAFSSKKGRPPKNINFSNKISDLNVVEGVHFDYQYAEDTSNAFMLADGSYVDGIFSNTYSCYGLVREFNGKKYLYDYSNSKHFVYIEDERIKNINLKIGDFIIGQAYEINPNSALLCSVTDVNFCQNQTLNETQKHENKIIKIDNNGDTFNEINNDTSKIKIVVELEADDLSIVTLHDKCIYFHSGEYDDIKRSYNAILDCSKLIKTLTANQKEFSLHLVDIDYIFSILDAHLTSVKAREHVDAVQFLKDILLNVKNAKSGNIIIYETNKFKRNSYLEAIINKYL